LRKSISTRLLLCCIHIHLVVWQLRTSRFIPPQKEHLSYWNTPQKMKLC